MNGQGPVPAAATIGRFAELGLDLIPGTGPLAACVPGAFGAWMLLLRDHGTLRLREVLEPAIGYAGAGFPAVPRVGGAIGAMERLFRAEWPSSAEVWLADGVPAPGGRLRNPALAATWRRLMEEAEAASPDRDGQIEAALAAFYEGFVAEAIDRLPGRRRGHGRQRPPPPGAARRRRPGRLAGDGRGAGVGRAPRLDGLQDRPVGPGPGPAPAARGCWRASTWRRWAWAAPTYVHTLVECAKLAFADREAWYGDPAAFDVPVDGLLDPAYADDAPGPGRRRGVAGAAPRLAGRARPAPALGRRRAGRPTEELSRASRGRRTFGDTCHVDVADRLGNLVAATPSGGWLQSSPVIPGLGFRLGTRAQMLWLEEGLASSLRPGTRPRTTLSPSLALRDGEPCLAFGTPGGDAQDQWTLQFFLAHARFGLDLQRAVDTPSFQSDHFPSSFWPRRASPGKLVIEASHDPATIEGLRQRGHLVELAEPWSLGRTCAAGRDPATGFLVAAANPRGRQAYAVGR